MRPPVATSEVRTEANAMPVVTSAEVLGNWDVVIFEGYRPVRMRGSNRAAFADFDEQGVRLRIECNYSAVGGAVRDGIFVSRPSLRIQTEMGCGKERQDRDERYFAFFARNPTVKRLPDGKLSLVAGETELVLQRTEERRLAFLPDRQSVAGTWRMESLTRYEFQGGWSGIGLSDVPGHIVIDGNRLSYDRCPQFALTFDYASDGRLVKTGGDPLPEKPDCPALNYPDYSAPALPSAMQILTLLHSNPWLEDVGNGQMLVANDQLGLLLARD